MCVQLFTNMPVSSSNGVRDGGGEFRLYSTADNDDDAEGVGVCL
jgi:hypothetical protein